jgi:hypothetical protein
MKGPYDPNRIRERTAAAYAQSTPPQDSLREALERMRRAYERGATPDDLARLIDAALALPVARQNKPELREVLNAAEILLNAKSGPYNYASWPQRQELEKAKTIWDRRLDS